MKSILCVLVCVLPVALAKAETTERVSLDSSGLEGNGISDSPAITPDGRFVAFASRASNLVPGDTNGVYDIFVHDRVTGATTRESVDSSGSQANGISDSPVISADGRYVAFRSEATNLVAGDTNQVSDVFVRDRVAGQTTRVSVDSNGMQGNAFGESIAPSISADGQRVAFESAASTLVLPDTNSARDVFVHELSTGITTLVSVDSSGVQCNATSNAPSISADGRFVAFWSSASNLVTGDTNAFPDMFRHDTVSGATIRVSVDSIGVQSNQASYEPSISADGRYVAFWSHASNLIADDFNLQPDIFVHDCTTGETSCVSINSFGSISNGFSYGPSISGDGRYVAFQSLSAVLVGGDSNGVFDVFLHDRAIGETTRVSLSSTGAQSPGACNNPSITDDGRLIAFSSYSPLVPGDNNATSDVFVHDRIGATVAIPYCSGDGSATACPCANDGNTWHGCNNSFANGGASLRSAGLASVSADSLQLNAAFLSPNGSVVFLQGSSNLNGGMGNVFGDGLLCVGGIQRLGAKLIVNGSTSLGAPFGDPAISVTGMVPASGGTFYYQAWYRNPDPTFCTSATFNTSNGLSIVWVP